MPDYTRFDASVHCEETFTIDPDELDEVQRLMAEDDSAWQGYGEWANGLEETERAAALAQFTFEQKQERLATVATPTGPMLIKRECAHRDCPSRCRFDLRIGGIAV